MSGNQSGLIVQKMADIRIVEFSETSILDQATIARIGTDLNGLVDESGHPKILMDFSNVKFVSSGMLGVLMGLHKKVSKAGGELRVAGVRSSIMQVFKLTRLDKTLKIYKTSEAALKDF